MLIFTYNNDRRVYEINIYDHEKSIDSSFSSLDSLRFIILVVFLEIYKC